jgi:hypothetical protein
MIASDGPVIIFSQKGHKGVILFPYASVRFDPRRADPAPAKAIHISFYRYEQ